MFLYCFELSLTQHLSLQSPSSFCMFTSSFFKLPKDDWSLDESLPFRTTPDCTCIGLKFALTFPCISSPYVPVYLIKSVSVTSADRETFE